MYGGVDKKCAVVAQFGPSTINTGVLLFRINPAGEKILAKWVEVHKHYANNRKYNHV